VKVTSTSLVRSGAGSTCQVGPMSQLNTTRTGGSWTSTRAQRHSLPSVPRS
jgi:hypothetical protein